MGPCQCSLALAVMSVSAGVVCLPVVSFAPGPSDPESEWCCFKIGRQCCLLVKLGSISVTRPRRLAVGFCAHHDDDGARLPVGLLASEWDV